MSVIIKVEHLKKQYPNAMPFSDLTVDINRGDVISIIGPSGTGKSTFLRCLNMLEKPTSGKITVNGIETTQKGADINAVRRKMGMVFQSFNLFGHKTIIENIMLAPMDLLKKDKQSAYERGMELLRRVGLADKAFNYPDELSGGQKQRIAIARALAMDPEIILFDEPTSALDPTMVGEVEAVIRDLAQTGVTMLIVTHGMDFAREVSNRIFFMAEGGLYEDGTPEQIFEHPKRDLTRRFIRRLAVMTIDIPTRDFDFIGTISQIEEYCIKNRVPYRTIQHIQSVFEELIMQLIIPKYAMEVNMNVTIEYSQESSEAYLTARYNGGFDPLEDEKDLSVTMIKGMAENIEYTEGDEGYSDMLRVTIK